MRWSPEMQYRGHVCSSKRHKKKNHLNRNCVRPSLYLALKCFAVSFLNIDAGINFFTLCCISACLPRTEAETPYWKEIYDDLLNIEELNKGIDAKLYTARSDPSACDEAVLRCFLEELKVIVHECGPLEKENTTRKVKFVNENAMLKNTSHDSIPKECKQCEQFQEENFTTFMEHFKNLIKKFISENQTFA
ncbi:interleukin-15 [Rhinatrema bivittatum]|uniref:interleukin-15 n=1 Tax=Rhinatrema bivittatum TaxID=194408 RepID=UPI001125F882|nr:interleukin-15 [Rhinatrema bivittatum]